jgi:hypothetical protein
LCLLRLILSRALQDDAFVAGFKDYDQFMTQPDLGDVDYMQLKWKDDMLDRHIFPLSYQQFNDIWRRVGMMAGLRDLPRLYALRVGAGARLDEHRE